MLHIGVKVIGRGDVYEIGFGLLLDMCVGVGVGGWVSVDGLQICIPKELIVLSCSGYSQGDFERSNFDSRYDTHTETSNVRARRYNIDN